MESSGIEDGSDRSESSDDLDATEDLLACLEDVQTEGNFYSCRTAKSYPSPGLDIPGYGTVGLPISATEAKVIAALCTQAPFGRKDKTLVDINVRRTWELDASRFSCLNPSWTEFLNDVTKKAVDDLGVQVPARAESYKLLLYEQGAFFKAHKDSEKVPGMFGSMIICLPSFHEGGEVSLTHAGQSACLATGPTSSFDLTTLAWYADVTHEIKPVTAGYRLVLTFNLVQDESIPRQTANILTERRLLLAAALRRLKTGPLDQLQECFVYKLDHKYTSASLRLANLKGQDFAVGQYLDKVCSDNGFFFFLANMTGFFKSTDAYGCEDDEEDGIVLDLVNTPQGHEIARNHQIEKKFVLQAEAFEGAADSEDEEEFTGNESTPSEYRYHSTVAVLVPKEMFVAFVGVKDWDVSIGQVAIDFIKDDLKAHPSGPAGRRVASHILQFALANLSNATSHDARVDSYTSHSSTYGKRRSPNLAPLIVSLGKLAESLSSDGSVRSVFGQIPIDASSSEALAAFVAGKMASDAHGHDEPNTIWDQWFRTTIAKVSDVNTMRALHSTFIKISKHITEQADLALFGQWAEKSATAACLNIKNFTSGDMDAALELVSIDEGLYISHILPSMVSAGEDRGVVLGYLRKLYGKLPANRCTLATFEAFLNLSPAEFCPKIGPRKSRFRYGFNDPMEKHEEWPFELADDFMFVLNAAWNLKLADAVTKILSSMVLDPRSSAGTGRKSPILDIHFTQIVSFITRLGKVIMAWNDKIVTKAAAVPIQSVLQSFHHWLANSRPSQVKNWKRDTTPAKPCGIHARTCEECAALILFLQDPRQELCKFPVNKTKRQHIRARLHERFFEMYEDQVSFVVQKTNEEYRIKDQQWKDKVGEAREKLRPLSSEFGKTLLGQDMYKRLVLLEPLPSPGATLQALQPFEDAQQAIAGLRSNANATVAVPPVAGVKRKLQVIDLTEDE